VGLAIRIVLILALLTAIGCTHRIDVQPIKVEPIYMTIDINLKVDRELDQFFDFQDEFRPPATQPAAPAVEGTSPATQPAPATTAPQGGAQ
jgi:hypothetical protein